MASIAHTALADLTRGLFTHYGLSDTHAALVADTLVQADLWGHQSHGVLRTPWYLERLRTGVMKPATIPETIVDAGAIAVWDARDGVGQIATTLAMDEAVKRAKLHGVGIVSVRNSNHFGTCMYYTRRAAEAGCIGFLTTNGGPAIAPWGSMTKLVGTNPWSWACPAGAHPPMMLDIANTGVARGKIYLARNKGEPIPEGWALTADGRPTTDPSEAIEGLILPMGGHKGSGIGLMMDVLSSALAGAKSLDAVNGPYKYDKLSGCGHFVLALDISRFRPLNEFERHLEEMIARVKSAEKAADVEEVYYPGELEAIANDRNRRVGLTLPEDTIRDLDREAVRADLTSNRPWSRQ